MGWRELMQGNHCGDRVKLQSANEPLVKTEEIEAGLADDELAGVPSPNSSISSRSFLPVATGNSLSVPRLPMIASIAAIAVRRSAPA